MIRECLLSVLSEEKVLHHESIREFCDRIGVAKRDNLIDLGLLEFCLREQLNKTALRRMVVFDPVKIIIDQL